MAFVRYDLDMSDKYEPTPIDSHSGHSVPDGSAEHSEIVQRILTGDQEALGELFAIYRPRLWRLVTFRLHPSLQGRIDAEDVLQDAWLRAIERIDHFYEGAGESFLWFRTIVTQTLIDLQRFHLGARKRSATREQSINGGWTSASTSSCLAFHLSDSARSPSSNASHAELTKQLDSVLLGMNEVDREILALRHFEALNNNEVAKLLNLSEQAASVRYIRALGRLKQILELVLPDAFDSKVSKKANG